MITFSAFQSLGEDEKLDLLVEYMDTYQIGEIAAHWHKTVTEIFNMQMDLIRSREKKDDPDFESRELSEMGKSLNMMTYDQLKALSPTDRAKLILKYHEMVEGKTGLLADCLGIEKKRMYNLIYASKKKIAESTKKREDVMMSSKETMDYNEENIDHLKLVMDIIENDMSVELNGEGSGKKVSTMLRSIASAIDDTGGIMRVDLKIKRPE